MNKKILMGVLMLATIPVIASCGEPDLKITFDANGGVVEKDTVTVKKGETTELPKPTKEGKTFLGWYTTKDDSAKIIIDNTKIEQEYNLYARWNTYDVNYYDNNNNLLYKVELADSSNIYDYGLNWDNETNIKIHADKEYKAIIDDNSTIIKTKIPAYSFKNSNYTLPFLYNDNYFNEDATKESSKLAKYAFGLSVSTFDKLEIESYLKASNFTNIKKEGYDSNVRASYTIASKDIDDTKVVILALRGFNYTSEWEYNFQIGSEGNHNGLNSASNYVYNALNSYVSEFNLEKTKILITGYSKGGAIAGLIGNKILTETNLVPNSNLYVYTYEAPRASIAKDATNIFNYINEADLIVNLIPEEYGLNRVGNEISIYKNNINTLIENFDATIKFKSFSTSKNYDNDKDYVKYIVNKLISYTPQDSESPKGLKTREDYYNNYQTSLDYLAATLFNTNFDQIKELAKMIKNNLPFIIANKDMVLQLVMSYLDSGMIEYEVEKLTNAINTIKDFINGPLDDLKSELLLNSSNATRMITMHYPITTYVLLMNYFRK